VAAFFFLLFSLLRSRSLVPRKSTTAISPSTLVTRLEIQLAEQRARKYWAMHAWQFGNDPFYLAVETSIIFPSEVQDKSPKLNFSETTASNRRRSYSYLVLKGVMIFDIRTGHFVGNTGFIAVDTPPLGGVARFGDYIARYIGSSSIF
jgi:hypothetical protein